MAGDAKQYYGGVLVCVSDAKQGRVTWFARWVTYRVGTMVHLRRNVEMSLNRKHG